jgi:hypothetical protein
MDLLVIGMAMRAGAFFGLTVAEHVLRTEWRRIAEFRREHNPPHRDGRWVYRLVSREADAAESRCKGSRRRLRRSGSGGRPAHATTSLIHHRDSASARNTSAATVRHTRSTRPERHRLPPATDTRALLAALLGGEPVDRAHDWSHVEPLAFPRLSFPPVPEAKIAKNRLHLDTEVEPGQIADPATRAVTLEDRSELVREPSASMPGQPAPAERRWTFTRSD